MGKETQFSRVKVVPVVDEKSLLRGSAILALVPNDSSAAIGLDLINRHHHDDAPISKKTT
jgi:hypothetical protein